MLPFRRSGARLLSLLHVLLLFGVALDHLLCLLLMALLDLLPLSLIGILSVELLVFPVLLLLKFLPILLLLGVKLFLLFLIFLVLLGISCVRRSRALNRAQVIGVHGVGATRVVSGRRIASSGIRGMMERTGLAGGHDPALVECPWFGSGSDRRPAMIDCRPQLWIRAGSLHVLPLRRRGWKMA